jgi:hypothetical protein
MRAADLYLVLPGDILLIAHTHLVHHPSPRPVSSTASGATLSACWLLDRFGSRDQAADHFRS